MQLTVDRGSDRIAITVYEAATAGTPLVVAVPAMGVPAGYYRRLAPAFHEAGLSLAVADLRGTGESAPVPSRASDYGYQELADDVAAVLTALGEQRAGRRTVLLGHSLGGQACLLHLARSAGRDTGVDALALIAVGLPYWRHYPGPGRFGILGFTQAINLVSAALGVWPGWGFGGRQARGVIRDWAYTARRGHFPPALGVAAGLAEIDIPVLAISVDDDRYTPPATMDHLASVLPSARVRREHLSTAQAGVPLSHFSWVKAGPAVAERIAGWLADVGEHDPDLSDAGRTS
jgi:predicted alpha/beta hydrolase